MRPIKKTPVERRDYQKRYYQQRRADKNRRELARINSIRALNGLPPLGSLGEIEAGFSLQEQANRKAQKRQG
jgi:uncharacterized protein YkwD